MILVRLKRNTRLVELDEFVTRFTKKKKNKDLDIYINLNDTECLIYMIRKYH